MHNEATKNTYEYTFALSLVNMSKSTRKLWLEKMGTVSKAISMPNYTFQCIILKGWKSGRINLDGYMFFLKLPEIVFNQKQYLVYENDVHLCWMLVFHNINLWQNTFENLSSTI